MTNRFPAVVAGVFILCAVLVVMTQVRNGAFVAELSDDAASHYISGLMIRDYLVSGFAMSPIEYVKWYHSHYPLIGIGHWGPAFYGLEAVWMLLFGWSRESVLLLSTVLTAVTAALIFHHAVRQLKLSKLASLFAAVGFVLCPVTQAGSSTVMLDIPITLCCVLALWAYTAYLRTERTRESLLFGAAAAFAILIKGNGALLALLPPLAVALTGKWHLVTRLSFWAPAILVALLTGPWTLFTYDQVAQGFRFSWGAEYFWVSLSENSKILFDALGPVVSVLVAIGLINTFARGRSSQATEYRCLAALLGAVIFFQLLVPAAIQDRYLAPALVPLYLFAAAGLEDLVLALKSRIPLQPVRIAVAAAAVLALVPSALSAHSKTRMGFRELAPTVWRYKSDRNPIVLIVTRNVGEGSAIAELAMNDPARPSIIAMRGSRLLGAGGYNRQDLYPKFQDVARVEQEIQSVRAPLVLYQPDPNGWHHIAQVDEVRRNSRTPWELVATAENSSAPVSLYRVPGNETHMADLERIRDLTAPNALRKY